ncbi:hypothetical protein L6164_016336 [Bauhinia variegata]|uniref:Uncharacterized protein n=1 Tax=Bauhinia variegata TaxID=167791 RepID=A0ACB9NNC8_BAUVA|nr:hypothetical protein L6164_016336 [Bauhinia variegata]
MISNPDFIFYACIAKGTTVLAQFRSEEPRIEELAAQCLEKTPPNHSMFSHTVRESTYTFMIADPFVYFAIFNEGLVKSEGHWFLNRLKCGFDEIIRSRSITASDDFSSLCFQTQFDSIIRELMPLDSDLDLDGVNPQWSEGKDSQNSQNSSIKGTRSGMIAMLENPIKGLKKKKRVSTESNLIDDKNAKLENKLDVCDTINGCPRDFAFVSTKSAVNDRQRAKQIWKKHVWVVLLLDIFVCAALFIIWLWVCRGFQCMAS